MHSREMWPFHALDGTNAKVASAENVRSKLHVKWQSWFSAPVVIYRQKRKKKKNMSRPVWYKCLKTKKLLFKNMCGNMCK